MSKLYKCQCRDCKLRDICGLLANNYCSYYNCLVPPPSEW
jgi:hypothetical protein